MMLVFFFFGEIEQAYVKFGLYQPFFYLYFDPPFPNHVSVPDCDV